MTERPASGGPGTAEAGSLRRNLASRGYGHCIVGGASMLPLLRPGDIVRIERRDRVGRGDIVAVTVAGTPAIHRIVSVTPEGIVCCGDNCRRRDPLVPAAAVYGVATLLTPGRRLRGGLPAYALARLRFRAMLLPLVGRSILDDASLVLRQAVGAQLPAARSFIGGPRVAGDPASNVLEAESVATLASLTRGGPDGGDAARLIALLPEGQDVEIRAGAYSGLDAAGRRRLLGRLAGRRVVVWGVLAEGSRVRLTSALRRLLGRLGVSVGEPGDAAFRERSGGWRPFHLFTPEGMGAELRAAGGLEVETAVVTTLGGVSYVRAAAQL